MSILKSRACLPSVVFASVDWVDLVNISFLVIMVMGEAHALVILAVDTLPDISTSAITLRCK